MILPPAAAGFTYVKLTRCSVHISERGKLWLLDAVLLV